MLIALRVLEAQPINVGPNEQIFYPVLKTVFIGNVRRRNMN